MLKINEKSKKKVFISVGVVIVIVAITIIAAMIYNSSPHQKLSKQLSLGNKFLSELNYEDAILAFEEAIKIDPMSEDAYIGITRAYAGLGKYPSAEKVLLKGIYLTNDETLKNTYFGVIKEERLKGKRRKSTKTYEDGILVYTETYFYDEECFLTRKEQSEYSIFSESENDYFWDNRICYYSDYDKYGNYHQRKNTWESYTKTYNNGNTHTTLTREAGEDTQDLEYTYYDYCRVKDIITTTYNRNDIDRTTVHYNYEFDSDGNLMDTKRDSYYEILSSAYRDVGENNEAAKLNESNYDKSENEYDEEGYITKSSYGNTITVYEYEYP